jgi:hypothetical protein
MDFPLCSIFITPFSHGTSFTFLRVKVIFYSPISGTHREAVAYPHTPEGVLSCGLPHAIFVTTANVTDRDVAISMINAYHENLWVSRNFSVMASIGVRIFRTLCRPATEQV